MLLLHLKPYNFQIQIRHRQDSSPGSIPLPDNRILGVINWFAVHPTSMNNTNKLISSDNVGYASVLMEKALNGNGTMPGKVRTCYQPVYVLARAPLLSTVFANGYNTGLFKVRVNRLLLNLHPCSRLTFTCSMMMILEGPSLQEVIQLKRNK